MFGFKKKARPAKHRHYSKRVSGFVVHWKNGYPDQTFDESDYQQRGMPLSTARKLMLKEAAGYEKAGGAKVVYTHGPVYHGDGRKY